jgi:hypothetical protein
MEGGEEPATKNASTSRIHGRNIGYEYASGDQARKSTTGAGDQKREGEAKAKTEVHTLDEGKGENQGNDGEMTKRG